MLTPCRQIHENPELAWSEHHAHDTICNFLESHSFKITRGAYNFPTSFESRTAIPNLAGEKCKTINFNAEYDALPGIGHGCGHNLIATASLVGYLALSHLIKTYEVPAELQLLGTPAEEHGGGKIELFNAGAFKGVDLSLMAHPCPISNDSSVEFLGGCAGVRTTAKVGMAAVYSGKSAHAGAEPWEGINALDALVSAYNNVSMLRQQMSPDCRIHGAVAEAPKVANIIPDSTKVVYSVRGPSINVAEGLASRVEDCLRAGALATGCRCDVERENPYVDLLPNETLCKTYCAHMKRMGKKVEVMAKEILGASTDQGNISREMPALHPMFGIPCEAGIKIHSREFATVAGTKEAFEIAIVVGKALAMTGWDILTKEGTFQNVKKDFEEC